MLIERRTLLAAALAAAATLGAGSGAMAETKLNLSEVRRTATS